MKSPFNNSFSITPLKNVFLLGFALFFSIIVPAQRSYKPNSILSTGNWYKIAVSQAGIYKIDIAFLNSIGVNTSSISSSSLRIFGNGGAMLPESNLEIPIDDLSENGLWIVDGGDGILNGPDYILFFALGPDQWLKDSINQRFSHRKNLYTDKSFYFLTVGGVGKRIQNSPVNLSSSVTIRSFNDRIFYELDTVNFLGSGKNWYGEEFANAPGKTLSRNFSLNIPNLQITQPITIISNCIARSVGVPSRFDIRINNQPVQQLTIPSVSGGLYDLFAQGVEQVSSSTTNQNNLTINYTYLPGSFNSQGWLNWFELFSRRDLSLSGINQLLFRDWNSVGNSRGEFVITNATSSTLVWEVTDPFNPVNMAGNFQNNEFRYTNDCSILREYVAFNSSDFLNPVFEGKVPNQDLHSLPAADYIVVSYPDFLPQAQRLSLHHQQRDGLRSEVVSTEQIFNEFSSGAPDPAAIRNFVKMFYDKATNQNDKPRYLLLLGDASYDYKNRINNNTNLVPCYESNSSLDPLSTYTSDDFFGFLDDNENINSGVANNRLDVGIGRIPAANIDEAKNYVDKVSAYYSKESYGPWRNNLTFIADDEDFNLHLQDAEVITNTAASIDSVFNLQKIYLDAFLQESGSGGSRYPQVNEIINNQVYNGTLIWNYNGHGGASRLAEEVILDQDIINNWNNPFRLPLFITATCDFAPYDNPMVNSIGENILLRPKTGGIALMTTTRVVFAFSNRILNNNYMQFALQRDANGKYRSLGEAIKETKNYTYQTSGDITNNRKFTLLGDPALTIAFPELKIRTTKINGNIVSPVPDTLKSMDKIVIEGEVTDSQGNILNQFNGTVYPTVFDKPQTVTTLGNDPTSQPVGFKIQTNALFKGKASVVNGKFSFSFKMPKDINYQFGNGKLSLYADDGSKDANGMFTGFIIGGAGNASGNDNEGPKIKAFLNDEKFVNGSITNQNPILIVKLNDSSGINTAGNGIGHDIVGTLDNDKRNFFVLNDFYESDLDSYQQGAIHFQLPSMEAGNHTLHIKAWDILNNSSEYILEFTVVKDEELVLSHVLNYPNPFTSKTQFWFEHNRPGQNLDVRIQVFTLTGRIVKTIIQTINTAGNRSSDIEWNGRDEYGDKLGRGVYLYKLDIIDLARKKAQKIEKLVIF